MKGKARGTDASTQSSRYRPKPLGKMRTGRESSGNVMVGWWGVGRLEQHCQISVLRPHRSGGTLPEEEVWYPGARQRGRLPNTHGL